MSHIKDRLSDYHDSMKKLVDDHQMILASDALEMIEQLLANLEQDEKENGWIPVSERLPDGGATVDILCACLKTIWKMYLFFFSIMNRSGLDSIQIFMIQLL